MRALGAVGRRHQLHEVGLVGAGDEALDPVDDVVVAVAHRGGAHAAGIGAGVGLGLREAGALLAAQHRQQILLLHLAGERVEDAAHGRAGDAFAARRQRDRARELLGHDARAQQRQAGAAVFLRHLHHPDAERPWRAGDEPLAIMRLDLLALERVALDRNELGVHEPPQRLLEHAQLLGKLEIHVHGSPYCRLATAPARRPRPRRLGPHHQRIDLDIGDAGAVIEIELRERERGRFERGAVGGGAPAIAGEELLELAARRSWRRPRAPRPAAAAAPRRGRARPARRRRRSAAMARRADRCAPRRSPRRRTPSAAPAGRRSGHPGGRRARPRSARRRPRATSARLRRSSLTPPASVLCRMSGERILSATGNPIASAAAAASAAFATARLFGSVMP